LRFLVERFEFAIISLENAVPVGLLKEEDVAAEEAGVSEAAAAAAAAAAADDDDDDDESVMGESGAADEITQEVVLRDAPRLNKLTAQQIRAVLHDVCVDMLAGLEVQPAPKHRRSHPMAPVPLSYHGLYLIICLITMAAHYKLINCNPLTALLRFVVDLL